MFSMPVDLDMFLSATRLNYSPFVDDHYSLRYDHSSSRLSFSRDHVVVGGRSRRYGVVQDSPVFHTSGKKAESKSPSRKTSATEELPDGTRKKKVSFADDKGLDLVKVREIDDAPTWSDSVMAILIGDQKPPGPEKAWRIAFEHPPWEDSKLVELLKKNKVVLETVSIKRGSVDVLTGTVKVKNLVYQKNVFVRISFDRWVSFVDCKAEYVKLRQGTKRFSEFDTFSFSIEIFRSAMRYGVIEFCVGFKCAGKEFWDNNGGINYRLVTDSLQESSSSHVESDNFSRENITLSLTENIQNFSEIDAWSNFMYNQPYW